MDSYAIRDGSWQVDHQSYGSKAEGDVEMSVQVVDTVGHVANSRAASRGQ